MNKTFKAAVLFKQKKPLKILDLEMPTSLERGQVLIKIYFSGICGSQVGEIDGVKGKDNYLPHLLGHEGSGKIIKKGAGTSKFKVGDEVVFHWKKNKGINAKPYLYKSKNLKINSGNVTSFSEYSVMSENRLTKVKDLAKQKISALFGCCLLTGFGVIKNDLKIKKNDRVAIFGIGGLGLANIVYLKKIKVTKILAIDIKEGKLKKAKALGSTNEINLKNTSSFELISILKKNNINKIVENTGNVINIQNAYEGVSQNGTVCLVGVPKYNKKVTIHTLAIHFGKRIIGCHGGTKNPEKDIKDYINMFKGNKFRELKSLLSGEGRIHQINSAINKVRKSQINGRYLINFL